MPRYLFIVARDRPEIYAELRHQFEGNADVEVLVDRRLDDRRVRQESRDPERRHIERRGQRGGNSHVRGIGGDPSLPALMVELEPGSPSPASPH
jgi:hypothetical protein